MNKKDRNITNFLVFFLVTVGLYMSISAIITLINTESGELFEFVNEDIPVFKHIAQLVVGLVSILSGFAMWMRVSWASSMAIFNSGLLIAFNLNNMGQAIYANPTRAIIMAVILIIMFQSFSFLMRSTNRQL
tara:strand:- start:29499 stop:29894 length:396 start_codon:yes stop_codon:yes gene_type:complete